MGYIIKQIGGFFTIHKENQDKALKALQDEIKKMMHDGTLLSFLNPKRILQATHLANALKEMHYQCEWNVCGDLIDLYFLGQKIGCEHRLFAVLAPFVESESYLSYEGEDGERWTYWFYNGTVLLTTSFVGLYRMEELLPF